MTSYSCTCPTNPCGGCCNYTTCVADNGVQVNGICLTGIGSCPSGSVQVANQGGAYFSLNADGSTYNNLRYCVGLSLFFYVANDHGCYHHHYDYYHRYHNKTNFHRTSNTFYFLFNGSEIWIIFNFIPILDMNCKTSSSYDCSACAICNTGYSLCNGRCNLSTSIPVLTNCQTLSASCSTCTVCNVGYQLCGAKCTASCLLSIWLHFFADIFVLLCSCID